jgi:hypothetical protein
MQSDERVNAALSALRPQIALFRYVISGTQERARNTLTSDSGPNQTRITLGDFAAGRIDADRFAMISAGAPPLDTIARAVVERTVEVLESLLKAGDESFVVDVKEGMRPGDAIRARLAHLGSVFAASALVELVRRRTYDSALHSLPIAGHPFEKWTTGERMLAPPLIVRARGPNVDAFDLAPLMDGCVRIVLLFDAECAPAPLVRLVSPGTFVAQTSDTKILEKFTDYEGPAVVALLKGSEARFVHDPRAGGATWQRMRVTSMPDTTPRKSLGSRSAWQQRDDLALLKSFVEPPSLTPGTGRSATSGNGVPLDPVERLTAWLIEQSPRDGVA